MKLGPDDRAEIDRKAPAAHPDAVPSWMPVAHSAISALIGICIFAVATDNGIGWVLAGVLGVGAPGLVSYFDERRASRRYDEARASAIGEVSEEKERKEP